LKSHFWQQSLTGVTRRNDNTHCAGCATFFSLAENRYMLFSATDSMWGLLHKTQTRNIFEKATSINAEKVKEANLLRQIEAAESHSRLAVGIEAIWEAAKQKKGNLLIGEKQYLFPAQSGKQSKATVVLPAAGSTKLPFAVAVDSTIAIVLQEGGTIEFVENGLLKKYHHMVLIHQD